MDSINIGDAFGRERIVTVMGWYLWRGGKALVMMVAFLLMISVSNGEAKNAEAILSNKTFSDAYASLYKVFQHSSFSSLVLELTDTIGDAIVSESHLRATSRRHKVNFIENSIFLVLKEQLCVQKAVIRDNSNYVRKVTVSSLSEISSEEGIDIPIFYYGRIAAIVVQIVEKSRRSVFCASTDFRSLVK